MNDPANLLEHAAWLRKLASSLVGDGAAVDDLVQETYVAALRRPPTTDRPIRPWLRRVLSNAARFRWRSERNRAQRESAVATHAERQTPTTQELLERHETQQMLARLVAELEEPYREAVLLRYAEGLAPSEIARRLEIPAGTVRSRISEGLARLRTRLDALHRGDRKAWIAALTPLARGGSTTWVPVMLFAGIIAIAAVVLVVPRHERTGSLSPHAVATSAAPAASPAPTTVGTPGGPVWLAQQGAPRRKIAGRVVADGSPIAGALVRLSHQDAASEQRTSSDGRFDFGFRDPIMLTISASVPGTVAAIRHLDLRDPRARTEGLELAITPCVASLWGRVTDSDGAPVVGARVLREDVTGSESDASGAYELCALPTAAEVSQLVITVRADGYGAIRALHAPKGRVHRDFVLTPEATLAGRVIGEGGEPIAHAKVTIVPDDDGTQAYGDLPAPVTVSSDASGTFEVRGLRGGRIRARAIGEAESTLPVSVLMSSGETRQITLKARATGAVRGRVIDADKPAAGARVSVRGAPSASALSQVDGTFVIARVPAGRVALEVAGFRTTHPVEVDVRAGAEVVVEISVSSLVMMRGTVRRRGIVAPNARVSLRGPSKLATTADASGAYEIAGVEPGSYELHADDTRMGAFLDTTITVPPTSEHRLDLELSSAARVRGTVVDPAGAPVAGAAIRIARSGDLGECVTSADGVFECGQMQGGGSYEVEVLMNESVRTPLPFAVPPPAIVLADGETAIENVRLVVEVTRLAIAGSVTDLAGLPVADASVRVLSTGRHVYRWAPLPGTITSTTGAFRIGGLAAGRYTVEVLTQAGVRVDRRDVLAGTTGFAIAIDTSTCDGDGEIRERTRDVPQGLGARPPSVLQWDGVELVGWTLPARVRMGEMFEVTLVYKVLKPLDRTWKAFAHFSGPEWVNTDHEPVSGRCPTTAWRAGDVILDRFTAQLPAPGRYELAVGFFAGPAPSWTNLRVSAAPTASLRDDGIRVGAVTAE